MLRPSASSFVVASVVGLGLGATIASSSCGAMDFAGDGGLGGAGNITTVVVGTGGDASDVLPDAPVPPAPLSYKRYCGEGDCVPGKDLTCVPEGTSTSSTGTAATGTGATGTAGTGTAATGSGSTAGSGGAGGEGGGGGGSAEAYTCRVAIEDDKPVSVCAPVGMGRINDPCQGSAQCEAGLACVEVSGASDVGLCLPYCCDKLEDCAEGTFCNPRDLVPMPTPLQPKRVPVCEPAVECSLLTPGACADDGKVCTVVRADGTTSCIDRGDGKTCDQCPCDDGYVCNPNINQCRKLCHTDSLTNECGGGTCQGGSSNYPVGIGICVGGESVCN